MVGRPRLDPGESPSYKLFDFRDQCFPLSRSKIPDPADVWNLCTVARYNIKMES